MDFYEVLGVRKSAGAAEVRRAYQKRARQLHPDLNPGDPVSAERFHVVSLAFEVLSDPLRRAQYDRGDLEIAPPVSPPEVGFAGFDFSAEVRKGSAGFHELFSGVLRPEGAPRSGEPTKGEDLEQGTRLTFDESLKGTSRHIHLVRADHCPICGGGGDVAFGPAPCPACHGAGQIRASRGHMIFTRACSECGGSGKLTRRPCDRCAGEGRLIHSEWIDVQIPAGAADGSRLRIPGCGNAGRRGGPAGDFVLVVEVEAHPVYRREGDDLFSVVPVSMTQAALGGHVEVETPEGPVTIEIPAGTQTGQRFRLRKRGVPKMGGEGRGDLYAEARVWVPAITDDRSRELLREVERLNPQEPPKEPLSERAEARR